MFQFNTSCKLLNFLNIKFFECINEIKIKIPNTVYTVTHKFFPLKCILQLHEFFSKKYTEPHKITYALISLSSETFAFRKLHPLVALKIFFENVLFFLSSKERTT